MTKVALFAVAFICGMVAVSCGRGSYRDCKCNVMNTGPRPRAPAELLPPETATLNGESVQLTRHHIIPWSVLREFSGTAIRYSTDATVRAYADTIIRNMMDNFAAVHLLRQPLGTTPSRSQDAQTITNLLHSYFIWLPGNIFYGPPSSMRLDDPGSGFDRSSIYVVGTEHFAMITRVQDLMVRFTNDANFQTIANFVDIVEILLKLSTMKPSSYNEHQWDLVSQKCRVKQMDCAQPTPPPHRELKRSIGSTFDEIEIVGQFCSDSLGSYVQNEGYLSHLNGELNQIIPYRGQGVKGYDPLTEYCLESYTCKYIEDRYAALMVES